MNDISRLPNELDQNKCECKVIIETPKGRRNKFKYEHDSGLFSLSNLLPEGFSFPFDFGFIPSTVAEDGDPLDVLVLLDDAVPPLSAVTVRLIGAIEAEQREQDGKWERNDRLIAVATHAHLHGGIKSLKELP